MPSHPINDLLGYYIRRFGFTKRWLTRLIAARVLHLSIILRLFFLVGNKHGKRGAKVVLGALTNVAWKSIGQIYRIGGARSLFDVASVNGFTQLPADVILYMRFTRNAMIHFKDGHKPLLATEVSWPSAQGKSRQKFDFDTTEAGQARKPEQR